VATVRTTTDKDKDKGEEEDEDRDRGKAIVMGTGKGTTTQVLSAINLTTHSSSCLLPLARFSLLPLPLQARAMCSEQPF
jgi:hypothetical protein